MESIDQKIIKLKQHFGWNNVDLARAAGVTKQSVGMWVKEGRMPSQEACANLKQRYNVNDLWLLGRSDVMFIEDSSLSIELEAALREIAENHPDKVPQVLRLLRVFLDSD